MSNVRIFSRRPRLLCSLFLAGLVGGGAALAGSDPISRIQARDNTAGVIASTTGGGHYLIGDSLDVKFSFGATQKADGSAHGQFRQSVELGGQLIEFHGKVTCISVDSVNRRAWIGGIVTRNNSVHPAFTTDIHEPGKDVWFRVLDSGEGQSDADRSTFLGFEGAAGIITSREYCDAQIWPDDNDRTSPVIEGNIQVQP